MEAGEQSVTFLRMLARAERAMATAEWAEAARLWQEAWAMDYRTWLAPTLYAPPTFAAFRANRDLALEAILACREQLPGWGVMELSD